MKTFVNEAFWRRSAVLLVLQMLLTGPILLVAWICSSDLFVVKYAKFMLTSEADEIRKFYPHYYRQLFLAARFINYGFPAFLLGVLAYFSVRHMTSLGKRLAAWQEEKLAWPHVFMPLLFAFVLLLLSYFGITPFIERRFEFQLIITRFFLVVSVLHVALLLAANAQGVKHIFSAYLFKNELPYSLAGTRILFGFFLYSEYQAFSDTAAITIGQFDKVGLPFIGWLINIVPVNTEIYSAFCLIGIVITVFIIIGFRTRFFLVINAIVVFYVVASPNFFGKIWHNQLIIWISWIMVFSPCADVWSLDSMRKGFGPNVRNVNYGFHLKVIWLHFGLIYFFAGVHKLALCGLGIDRFHGRSGADRMVRAL